MTKYLVIIVIVLLCGCQGRSVFKGDVEQLDMTGAVVRTWEDVKNIKYRDNAVTFYTGTEWVTLQSQYRITYE